jgi:hypothetical protein
MGRMISATLWTGLMSQVGAGNNGSQKSGLLTLTTLRSGPVELLTEL